MSRFARKERPPAGFEILEPTLTALEAELREKVNQPHEGLRRGESLWPVHQINWQRSRYVYDMYHVYKEISREVYDYCIRMKLVDAGLMAKWKKPGYGRLCSTYVINPKNYKFGTVSICRVPRQFLEPDTVVEDSNTGCRGCASGPGGQRNIFGNKYGQYLAAIQVARKKRALEEEARRMVGKGREKARAEREDSEGDEDSEDEEAGIWAQNEEEAVLGPGDDVQGDVEADREAKKFLTKRGGEFGAGGGSSDKRPRHA
ncbi:G10 protein-domain-containing protein [Tribonema minus]|uniref:G10 protein-domain-containing protein n=1 Tax=Tribonema minus TaxID=303371 RepID=A0A835YRC4_9STRA|nr:G10 protein-domain-containing protein [Tribonema minus]